MSKRIAQNLELLRIVASCKKNLRCSLVKNGSKDFISSICELADNLLNHNVQISRQDYEKLYKYKGVLRKLIKKSPLKIKKKLISQKGGFLQFLIPAVLSTIGSIVSHAINKRI